MRPGTTRMEYSTEPRRTVPIALWLLWYQRQRFTPRSRCHEPCVTIPRTRTSSNAKPRIRHRRVTHAARTRSFTRHRALVRNASSSWMLRLRMLGGLGGGDPRGSALRRCGWISACVGLYGGALSFVHLGGSVVGESVQMGGGARRSPGESACCMARPVFGLRESGWCPCLVGATG